MAAEAWDPYHEILEKLYNKYNKDTFTGEKPTLQKAFDNLIKSLGLEEE